MSYPQPPSQRSPQKESICSRVVDIYSKQHSQGVTWSLYTGTHSGSEYTLKTGTRSNRVESQHGLGRPHEAHSPLKSGWQLLAPGRAWISCLQECDPRGVVPAPATCSTPTHIQAALSGPSVIKNKACEVGRKMVGGIRGGRRVGGAGLGIELIKIYGILNKNVI